MIESAQDTPPLIGSAAQLETLARVLLAERSTLEALLKMVVKGSPTVDVVHSAIDQLDTAFVIVNALQLTAGMADVGPTIETPAASTDGRPEKPPVFGAKRRAAAAAAQLSTNSPGATDGRIEGGTPPRGDESDAGGARDQHDGGEADRSDGGPERASVGATAGG